MIPELNTRWDPVKGRPSWFTYSVELDSRSPVQYTVAAEAFHPGGNIEDITPADQDAAAPGHQVVWSGNEPIMPVFIEVKPEDGVQNAIYEIYLVRPPTAAERVRAGLFERPDGRVTLYARWRDSQTCEGEIAGGSYYEGVEHLAGDHYMVYTNHWTEDQESWIGNHVLTPAQGGLAGEGHLQYFSDGPDAEHFFGWLTGPTVEIWCATDRMDQELGEVVSERSRMIGKTTLDLNPERSSQAQAGPAPAAAPGRTAAPAAPQLTGESVGSGEVELEWNEDPAADSHEVRYGRGGAWETLAPGRQRRSDPGVPDGRGAAERTAAGGGDPLPVGARRERWRRIGVVLHRRRRSAGNDCPLALRPVTEGTEIAVTMSFANLESDSDTSTTDYIFRADVVDADACEGGGIGVERYMYQVDEDPEVRAGTISAACAPGEYTIEASISAPDGVELASASASFSVVEPAPPLSTDATLRGLALSGVTLAFDSATTAYTASVENDVAETTVTPAVNHDGATYEIKLGRRGRRGRSGPAGRRQKTPSPLR